MYRIAVRDEFAASHVLEGLGDAHPCARLHGHTWSVTLELESEQLDEHGFVVDFLELAPFHAYIDECFEHRHLNDVVSGNPTSENLARHLYGWARQRWPEVVACTVSEGAGMATYREDGRAP
jgi:6-pyruvoyltetrahydropterin/6-carboxytetrahydropterin synthase